MNISAQPLPQHLYEAAIEAGIQEITLGWSGGHDNGYLEIQVYPDEKNTRELIESLEEWAWEAYSYNGAGDGQDYGDDITYDLVNKETRMQCWYMVRETEDGATQTLQIQTPEPEPDLEPEPEPQQEPKPPTENPQNSKIKKEKSLSPPPPESP